MRLVQVLAEAVDFIQDTVTIRSAEGETLAEGFDALVIATGAENGLWRRTRPETWTEEAQVRTEERVSLGRARSVAIVGAGASGVSAACGIAKRHPEKLVTLCYNGSRILPDFPSRVSEDMRKFNACRQPGSQEGLLAKSLRG